MIIVSHTVGSSLVIIEFDATLREDHTSTTQVTEYHVEVGANVSDHARPELDKVTFDVIVTNTPIRPPNTNTDGVEGSVGPLNIVVPSIVNLPRLLPGVGLIADLIPHTTITTAVNVLSFDGEMDRPKSVYTDLKKLQNDSTLVNISSHLRDYSNMIIRSLSAPRTAADGSSITFSVTATEIRFVNSETVTVKTDVGGLKSAGVKPAKEVSARDRQSTLDKAGTDGGVLSKGSQRSEGLH